MSDTYQTLTNRAEGNVAVITLNRPKQMNDWTGQIGIEVRHTVAKAEDDTNVVGIVVTGECKAFCACAGMALPFILFCDMRFFQKWFCDVGLSATRFDCRIRHLVDSATHCGRRYHAGYSAFQPKNFW